jgi:hypothetical protein
MTGTPEYRRVLTVIRELLTEGHEFTTDDVWPRLGFIPIEPNVVGKGFSELNRLGEIEGTERFVKSKRPEARGRRVQVWTAARHNTAVHLF